MAVETLRASTHLRIKLPRRGRAGFRVEAEYPVTTYVVDRGGLNAFMHGEDIPSVGGFTNRREHDQTLRLPYQGDWYLLVVNDRDFDVPVFYEVYR